MAGLGDAAYQTADRLEYMSGFGNMFATEALPGALPVGQNSPQHCPYGLYAELLSGTAFTASRPLNRRTWLYRIRPSAAHGPMRKISDGLLRGDFDGKIEVPPDRLRWDPTPLPSSPTDFVAGLITMGGNGSPEAQTGCAVHIYAANRSMTDRFFCNSDGELLLVPQLGRLRLLTEMGQLDVAPLEVATIPRGVRFRVELPDGPSRGYVCENFGPALTLPNLGPIGSNGLANPRDFLTPVARYEDRTGEFELVTKFLGRLWSAKIDRSPLDVVAWHGNCAPYKYDLQRFNAIGSISFDHPDPSIYLVLHSPYDNSGTSNIDFVVFAPRWMVSENTFRPPWFHRNIASEFMGLIHGTYDAKAEGFVPGGASLHNCMTAHGPDAATFDRAIQADTQTPHRITGSMAFMFETRTVIRPTRHALTAPQLQADYGDCWSGLPARFDPRRP